MTNIVRAIKARRSVRTYGGRTLSEETKEKLMAFANEINNPFLIPVEFRFLDAKEYGLQCPVVIGTDLFVGGKIENVPYASLAFGYSFERFVLYAQSLGLGTVWLGGTMNRPAFENAMEIGDNEVMPCASPIGYIADKMSIRETMMRKAIKADERLPFEELFFIDSFSQPLTREGAAELALPLEMVRLAPSAVNKQPWRVLICGNTVHFYLNRSKNFSYSEKLDMQMIDMGIALCHFDLSSRECGMECRFVQMNPQLSQDMEYIGSFELE